MENNTKQYGIGRNNLKEISLMKEDLITVIVPIYNVAPYLRKCLDSLKGQTLEMESFRSTSYVRGIVYSG